MCGFTCGKLSLPKNRELSLKLPFLIWVKNAAKECSCDFCEPLLNAIVLLMKRGIIVVFSLAHYSAYILELHFALFFHDTCITEYTFKLAASLITMALLLKANKKKAEWVRCKSKCVSHHCSVLEHSNLRNEESLLHNNIYQCLTSPLDLPSIAACFTVSYSKINHQAHWLWETTSYEGTGPKSASCTHEESSCPSLLYYIRV